MRICYVLAGDYAWDTRVEKMLGSLLRVGHEVFVVCAQPDEQPFREARDGLRICPMPVRAWLPERIKAGIRKPVFFSRHWLNWITRIAGDNGCDAIVVRDLPLAMAGVQAGERLHKPVVLDLADNYPASLGSSVGGVAPVRVDRILRNPAVAGILEDAVIGRAARVILACEEMRKRVVERGVAPTNAAVVLNTPTLQRVLQSQPRARPDSADEFVMVYAGPVEAWAGLDTVLRAMPDIRTRLPGARLAIVGTGKESVPLQSVAEQLGVRAVVDFIPIDHPSNVASYMASADLGVLPHHRHAHSDTALPAVLFEYMAQARAIVTSDAAPLRRIVENEVCGTAFRSGDPLSFAHAVFDMKNPVYRQKLGESGRQAVTERFHWEREAEVLTRLFAGLASTTSAAASHRVAEQSAAAHDSAAVAASATEQSSQDRVEDAVTPVPRFPPTFEVLDRAVLEPYDADESKSVRDEKYALELHSARRNGDLVFRVVLQKRASEDSPQHLPSPSRREWFHDSLEDAGRSFASMSRARSAVHIGHREVQLEPTTNE